MVFVVSKINVFLVTLDCYEEVDVSVVGIFSSHEKATFNLLDVKAS